MPARPLASCDAARVVQGQTGLELSAEETRDVFFYQKLSCRRSHRLRGTSSSAVEATQATSLIEESQILAELAVEKEKLTGLLQQREREQATARAAEVVPEDSVAHGLGESSNTVPVSEGARHSDVDSDEEEFEVEETQRLRAEKLQQQQQTPQKQRPAPAAVASTGPAIVVVEKDAAAATMPVAGIMEAIPAAAEPKASAPELEPAKALSPEEVTAQSQFDASPSVHLLKAHIATLRATMAGADVQQAQAVALAAREGVALSEEDTAAPAAGEMLATGVKVQSVPKDGAEKLRAVEDTVPDSEAAAEALHTEVKAEDKATSAKAVPAPESRGPAAGGASEDAVDALKARIEDAEGGSEETEAEAESFLVKYALWISIGTLLAGVLLTTAWCAAYNQEKRAPRGLPRKRGW